jgi:putative transposase
VNKCGFLIHLDTIKLRIKGKRRYIITAVDSFTRIAFAYAYSSHSSLTAQDFLFKLHHFFAENLVHIHTDNGSEFAGEFDNALKKLNLKHWFSRVRTCNDNAKCERFNRTLQDEITLKFCYPKDISQFNAILMQWLFEYLSIRPHQSLDYLTPLHFLSTISSSSTNHF